VEKQRNPNESGKKCLSLPELKYRLMMNQINTTQGCYYCLNKRPSRPATTARIACEAAA
jgi:hypothetical protein